MTGDHRSKRSIPRVATALACLGATVELALTLLANRYKLFATIALR